jgi:large subunit ribosomal protein L29
VKASELRTLSEPELQSKVREVRDALFNARVKRATGQLENTAKLNQLRRDVARVETILTEKRGAKQ